MKKVYQQILCISILTVSLAGCSDEGSTPTKGGKDGKVSLKAKFYTDVIYGEDNRLDLYQVEDERLLLAADSTVAVMSRNDLKIDGETTQIHTRPYATT